MLVINCGSAGKEQEGSSESHAKFFNGPLAS